MVRKTVPLSGTSTFLNILMYGNEGTAKTTNLATMANLGRTLFINAEAGLEEIALRKRGIKVENIEVFPDPDDPNEEVSFAAIEELYWQMKADLEDDPDSWFGTVWDSGTEIVKLLLEDVVEDRVEKKEAEKAKGKSVSELLTNRFFTDRDEYGEVSGQIRWLLRRFRDLPCHFGITTLMRRDVDQEDGKVHYGPAVNPAVQADMLGWMKIVCRTTADVIDGKDIFVGHFRAEGKYRGKDRLASLPVAIEEPTFERILGFVKGDLIAEEEETPKVETIQARRQRLAAKQQAKAQKGELSNA
jgi:hypothetical protein